MTQVFAPQDDGGTASYFHLAVSTLQTIAVGDTGSVAGYSFNGTTTATAVDIPFVVTFVHVVKSEFVAVAANANLSDWPIAGATITWTAGANAPTTSLVGEVFPANAYMTTDEFSSYHLSRGNLFPASPHDAIEKAIVQATDYIDQKYRFSGIKLLQSIGTPMMTSSFLEGWLMPYALNGMSVLAPSTSKQSTEWPRQGVIDFNGDTINGVPKAVKAACAELAIRVLNGVVLQPDYDPGLVGAGGVVSSVTKKVGPLETVTAYDTKLGLGFFASFPIVDRILSKAGLLSSGGSRTVIR